MAYTKTNPASRPMDMQDFERDFDAVLNAALRHVPFDGWSARALMQGTKDAGFGPADAVRFFPRGAIDAIGRWSEMADAAMEKAVVEAAATLNTRERIVYGIRARLTDLVEHKEAVRRAMSVLAQPQNAALGARLLYRTVDRLWYAAGDQATDFNHYTKRAILAAIYSATILFWIGDRSAGSEATWRFLARRLDDHMRVDSVLRSLRRRFERFPNPFVEAGHLRSRMRSRRFRF